MGQQVQAGNGSISTDSVTVYPGNTPPEVHADITSAMPWTAGETIDFTVSGTDAEDGVLSEPGCHGVRSSSTAITRTTATFTP